MGNSQAEKRFGCRLILENVICSSDPLQLKKTHLQWIELCTEDEHHVQGYAATVDKLNIDCSLYHHCKFIWKWKWNPLDSSLRTFLQVMFLDSKPLPSKPCSEMKQIASPAVCTSCMHVCYGYFKKHFWLQMSSSLSPPAPSLELAATTAHLPVHTMGLNSE